MTAASFFNMAYSKKERALIIFILDDLFSKVEGFIYKDPNNKIIGEKSAILLDDEMKKEIIKNYQYPDIKKHD